MSTINIESIDPTFNFKEAYKRNYSTLINIAVVPKELVYTFKVDMIQVSIQYPKDIYEIVYREWQNKNWFKLKLDDQEQDLYWSSIEKANEWFKGHVDEFGLEGLTRERAHQVAFMDI